MQTVRGRNRNLYDVFAGDKAANQCMIDAKSQQKTKSERRSTKNNHSVHIPEKNE